jgi:hypothetical protein
VRLFGRSLNRQISRFCTTKDAVDVACGQSRTTCRKNRADLAKEKGRQFGGPKVWFGEDPSPKNDLEEHVGMVRFFDLDQTVAARMY